MSARLLPVPRLNPFTLISLGALLADQALDLLIESTLPVGTSLMLVSGWLGVTRLSGPRHATLDTSHFFIALTVVIVPFLWWFKWRINPDGLYRVAVAVLLGGLLGNLADGWRLGYPVDYLLLGIPFNVADAALILGGGLLIYRILKNEAANKDR